jgi:hypothetical protein
VRLPKWKRKFLTIVLTTGVAFGVGGIAAAYIGVSGTGTGSAKVGSAKDFKVALYGGTATTFTPAKPTNLTFTVQNVASYKEHATTVTVKVETTGGNVIASGTVVVPTCLASWFTVKLTRWEVDSSGIWHTATTVPVTYTLTPTLVIHVTVLVKMLTKPTPQTACVGKRPKVKLTVNK